ncbi:MAG TPA: SDR family NAD(P)-dependent oxidoreductase [Planctomycetia bacterium]|nr:SDR family NAD(P)-dependent oxidoreductase [Planctomycetia bacterium]
MKLSGRRVLVTGAAGGLGRAIAAACAAKGAFVVVTDVDGAKAEAAARKIGEDKARGYRLDVTKPDEIAAVREKVNAELGPIDALVNNAGVVFAGPLEEVAAEKHAATVAINLGGVIAMTREFLPDLVAKKEAAVVNIASAAAVLALPLAASYAASKWGVLGFSDSLREELRLQNKRRITVTAICPSFIATGLFEGAAPARFTRWLTAAEVAATTVRSIERKREFVMLPHSARLLYGGLGWLPRPWFHAICRRLGVAASMMNWKGRS